MTNSMSQVSAAGRTLSDTPVDQPAAKPICFKEANANARTAKIATGVGLATTLVLGIALKDGINEGFKRIGTFANRISNLIAVPFAFLFPVLLLDNERAALRGESKGKDDIFSRMTYTMASLVFTPLTFGDQLITATKSKGHMAATLLNLHNTLYCLLTYTGGRLLGFISSLKMKFSKDDPARKYRAEQEFEAFYTLGNLGSAQASIIPMAGQFVTGWSNIIDIFKGDFGSVKERFKDEPVSALMGTMFNAFLWPFEWFSKLFDTTCRTAETVENFENAFKKQQDSPIPRALRSVRDWFHNKVQNPSSGFGSFLKTGRKISMNLATYIPPIGMMSVVLPTMNRYFKGEIWNKEAQEIGGLTGLVDKVFSTAGFLGHVIYTLPYALVVRLPQTATHAMFYGTRLMNNKFGTKLDPHEIRDKMFNWGPFKAISNWASKKLDKLELELHPDDPVLINDTKDKDGNIIKGKGKNRNIRTLPEVIVQEICMVAKERLYKELINTEMDDAGLKTGKKGIGEKPSNTKWAEKLKEKRDNGTLLKEAEQILREHLAKSEMLEQDQINEYISKYFYGNSLNMVDRFGRERTTIKDQFNKSLNSEIENLTSAPKKEQKIKSENLFQLLTNPKELWEMLKLKTFHLTNSFLMFWVNGFVNSSDFGDKTDKDWETDLNVRMFAIRELDTQQACNRELMPVVNFGFQSMIDGWLLARSVPGALFGGGSLYSRANETEHSLAA